MPQVSRNTNNSTSAHERNQSRTAMSARIVEFLSGPAAYDFSPAVVDVKETHMSWVFLANEYVFKLKKPIRLPYLDFSTLKSRKQFCDEEVRLNRRLAPNIYLGTAPVTVSKSGALAIGGQGRTADWLVKMRRLPADRTLNCAIADGTATKEDLSRFLDLLFSFFAAAAPLDIDEVQYAATLQAQHLQNRIVLLESGFELSPVDVSTIIENIQRVIDNCPDWFLEPVRNRRIIEGHGDLRPEHICLTDPPVIIDCLEFNAAFRRLDPFDELSYLALECRMLGAADLADMIIPQYAEKVGVDPPQKLLDFYTAYRATIRARLAIAHLLDAPPHDVEKWTARAQACLSIAQDASLNLSAPKGL